ncbi:predicted protein [Postia placenta Mad-698-R]|nr:predicted protein [Postia placenta Mad-698-R]
MLYLTVHVSLLNHTDIRPVHHSLFERKSCLGIYCVAGQMQCAAPVVEPVFLHFTNPDCFNLWLALLRSYAQPEVYGRWLSPASDGGLYRMWRQVELTCLQGRNLGTTRPLSPTSDDTPSPGSEDAGGGDLADIDVYCEVFVNGCLCGRTTVKRGIGAPDWQERFVLADLPPFENMELVVWREKRLAKPAVVGSVTIVLANFRRSEVVEGWFPVLGGTGGGTQAGELRLKVLVDEEIILPYSEYAGVVQTFSSRNSLDLIHDLESKLKLKTVGPHIISVAIAKNVLIDNIMELIDREVDDTLSLLTKTIELFMAQYGGSFLEASVGPPLRRLCMDKIAIEVDPVRSGKSARNTEKNVEQLVYWCQEFWNCIYDARTQCPHEMRRLFEHVRKLVEQRCRVSVDHNRQLPWQSVSAFCFLRFIVPAILHPHLFGLWPGLPEARVQRSLTLIAKVIQNLANLNARVQKTVQKEGFMRGVKDFLTNSLQGMVDYIVVVSTPDSEETSRTASSSSAGKHENLRIVNALHRRGGDAPVLYREAIPLLPHLLDLPKHLAVITALVVRQSRARNYLPSRPRDPMPEEGPFGEFCAKCMQVEERAVRRVSQLANRPRRQSSSHPNPQAGTQALAVAEESQVAAFGAPGARRR